MEFYFCGRYINTDTNEKEVEWDIYAALSYFQNSNDHIGYEECESSLEIFFLVILF